MLKSYLIIERTALPDYFLKVVEARKLLENGVCDQVSEAVRRVGISRSTYYKYKDRIIEPSELNIGHKATLMLTRRRILLSTRRKRTCIQEHQR